MKKKSAFWNGPVKVQITAKHIDRALKAIGNDIINLDQSDIRIEGAILAAGVIAHLDALYKQTENSSFLVAVAEEAIYADYLKDWVMMKYDLIDPAQKAQLDEAKSARERASEKAKERADRARATREAKRAAEIEAEVQKRLALAA
jgi:hypothetical protein